VSRSCDEEEYQRIHFVRVACQRAGLIRKHAGAFQLTKKGARLVSADRVVDLYLDLFQAGFSKVNLAAFDGAPDYPSIQYSLPVALPRLWEEDTEWVLMEQAHGVYPPPEPYYELEEDERFPGAAAHTVWLRLFRWFQDFGLIEGAVPDGDTSYLHCPERVRISDPGRWLLDFDRPEIPPPFF